MHFYSVPDFPDYHPEFPGGKPEGGRTLECPPFPYGELGAWRDRVGVSPYYPDFTMTIAETTLGRPVPQPATPAVKAKRRANDERGMGLALVGRLLKVLPGSRYRAANRIPRDRVDHEQWRRGRCAFRWA